MNYVQVYTISTKAIKFQVDPFTSNPPLCEVSYTFEIDDPDGLQIVNAFNDTTRTFTFEYLTDLKPLKSDFSRKFRDFEISVIGTVGTTTPIKTQSKFTLRVVNPCYIDIGLDADLIPDWCPEPSQISNFY